MRAVLPLSLCILILAFSGCIQQIAVSTVGSIVDDGFAALTEEQDLEFAGQALPANLKLLEVMLKNDPKNARVLALLAQGYSSYALGFVEDSDPERAKMFYARGSEYALRILRRDEQLARALDGSLDDLERELATLDRNDVPAVFWAAFGLGSYINLALDNPDAVLQLPKAEAMMRFVADTDSEFYYGGAHIFLGTLYGSRGRILGGDPDRSREHFERALRINHGRFLMTYVYYARSYAVQTLDEDLFGELLAKVQDSPIDILPEMRLANAIAKKKGRLLLDRKSDLF